MPLAHHRSSLHLGSVVQRPAGRGIANRSGPGVAEIGHVAAKRYSGASGQRGGCPGQNFPASTGLTHADPEAVRQRCARLRTLKATLPRCGMPRVMRLAPRDPRRPHRKDRSVGKARPMTRRRRLPRRPKCSRRRRLDAARSQTRMQQNNQVRPRCSARWPHGNGGVLRLPLGFLLVIVSPQPDPAIRASLRRRLAAVER